MNKLLFLFTLKPIVYGFIGMLVSGLCFPLAGVVILRNNLVPMRYMLMHGVLLGGIFSIALKLPLLPVVIAMNIVLVGIMYFLNGGKHSRLSTVSSVMMVFTMGLASLLSHIFDVPAKDTLELLWGSPFALTLPNLAVLFALGILLILYVVVFFKPISLLFFDQDIAKSCGVNVRLHNFFMLLITALVISVAMKMVGALLIDALVILPVAAVSKNAKSLKGLFAISAATGFGLSLVSYLLSLLFNLPVGGTMAVLSVVIVLLSGIYKFLRNKGY